MKTKATILTGILIIMLISFNVHASEIGVEADDEEVLIPYSEGETILHYLWDLGAKIVNSFYTVFKQLLWT